MQQGGPLWQEIDASSEDATGQGGGPPGRSGVRWWFPAGLGVAALVVAAVVLFPIAPPAEQSVEVATATASDVSVAVPALTATADPTPTPGCGYAAARSIVPPALVAVPGAPPTIDVPALEAPLVPLMAGGFLDLPVPYDGSPEAFRRLVNRSSLGGLITSYFDHEYPLYPWSWHGFSFGGSEPADAPVGTSVLAYDGTRLGDDWYTGHAGFDLAPLPGLHDATPILAAADGIIERAVVLSDGNHLVEVRHTVPGLGGFLTIYMHLQDDMVFGATRMRVGGAVQGGERIGTMGSTGKSTGVHLHFEVRYDANGDGVYDRQERVDPFGYVPLETPDPWAQDASWMDVAGRAVMHTGIVSRYLWRQPLGVTVEVGDGPASVGAEGAGASQGGGETSVEACVEPGTFPPEASLVVAWAPDIAPSSEQEGTGNGCVVYAQDATGQPIQTFSPSLPVTIPYSPEQVQFVDPDSLTIYLYDPIGETWEALPTIVDVERRVATAGFPRAGRCALRGRPLTDRLPPRTTIQVLGTPGDQGAYLDQVTVSLQAEDQGGSGVAGIRYSLDFGATWLNYTRPFTVSYAIDTPVAVDGERDTEDTVVPVPGERVILAQAQDNAGNVEYPPAIASAVIAAPRPELTFYAAPGEISPPCCATLTWDVTNADEVYLDGAPVGARGDEEVCPESSQTYSLRTVSRYHGESIAEARVEVRPVRVAFSAEPVDLACGRSTTLRWDVQNAQEVYLDGEWVQASGNRTLCLVGSQAFTLRVVPPCGPVIVRTVGIDVRPLTATLSVSPQQVFTMCQCAELTWAVENAEHAYLDGVEVPGRGAMEVCPLRPQTWVLRAEAGCCEPVESRVTVQTLGVPPIAFSADRTGITKGQPVTLQWAVDNIQAVYLDGEGVAGHDSRVVWPTTDHVYTLVVNWACGKEVRQIPIYVAPY